MSAPINAGIKRTRSRELTPAQRKRLDGWAAERDVWLRQDGEPEHAYQAFLAMRDAPHPRPNAETLCLQSGGPAKPQTWRVWSSRWLWAARIEAWDRHVQAPVTAAIVARHVVSAEEVADRQIEHARCMHELATHELHKLMRLSKTCTEPILGAKTLMQLITLALEFEKQLIPVDAERPGDAHRINFSHLDTTDLQRLREIALKCRVKGSVADD